MRAPATSKLTQSLQDAEQKLEERSGIGSASSEERDALSEKDEGQDDLEITSAQSNASSNLSGGSREKAITSSRTTCEVMSGSVRTAAKVTPRRSSSFETPEQSTIEASMYPLTDAQQSFMDDFLAEQAATQQLQVAQMQERLDDQRVESKKDVQDLMARIDELLSTAKTNEQLQARLDRARLGKLEVEEAGDDLKDDIVHLLARMKRRDEIHEQKMVDDKKEAEALAVEAEDMNANEEAILSDELVECVAALHASRSEVEEQLKRLAVKKERGRQNDLSLASLMGSYNSAKREIDRRDRAETSRDLKSDDSVEADRLETILQESLNMQSQKNAEIEANHLELLRITAEHNDEIAKIQARLNANTGKGAYRKANPSKLAAIEEEIDTEGVATNASTAISGSFSRSSHIGVDGLSDPEDSIVAPSSALLSSGAKSQISMFPHYHALHARIAQLTQEAMDAEARNEKLMDDRTIFDEEHQAKIRLMGEKLKELRSAQHAADDLLSDLQDANADDKKLQLQHLDQEHTKMREMELMQEAASMHLSERQRENDNVQEAAIDDIKSELCFELEATRLEHGRLLDLKRELAIVKKRQTSQIEDLHIQIMIASADSDSTVEPEAHQLLLGRLKEAEHDCNIQRNENDSIKIRITAEIEQEQLMHAVTASSLDKAKVELARESRLKEDLKAKLSKVREELAMAHSHEPVEPQPRCEQSETDLQKKTVFLGSLRCPARSHEVASGASADIENSLLAECATNLWTVISQLRGVVALQCTRHLQILEATRKAFEIWGSSSLRRSASVESLLCDTDSATMLREEITSGNNMFGDFSLREVGCLEFRDKNGYAIDSAVIVGHFPSAAHSNTEASVLIILEPLEDARKTQKRLARDDFSATGSSRRRGGIQRGHHGTKADTSSITSSDICPGDSVSNLF